MICAEVDVLTLAFAATVLDSIIIAAAADNSNVYSGVNIVYSFFSACDRPLRRHPVFLTLQACCCSADIIIGVTVGTFALYNCT